MTSDPTPSPVLLRGGGASVVVALDAVPRAVHWGADVGPLDAEALRALAAHHDVGTAGSEPDVPRVFALWIGLSIGARGSLWSEPVDVVADDVEVLATYSEDDLAGGAAVTWRPVGAGGAGYVSTRLGVEGLGLLLPALLERAGVASELPAALRGTVELAVRRAGGRRVRFLINRTDGEVRLDGIAGEYLVGEPVLAPRGVAVVADPA